MLFFKCKRHRIIDSLRKQYPGNKWQYNAKMHHWDNLTLGFYVYPVSHFTPRYDGDDDSFTTEYYRSDTDQVILDYVYLLNVCGY